MSLPARFQHHQPLGAPPKRPSPRPSSPVVYARSTVSTRPRRSTQLGAGWWQAWDAELFENWRTQ